MADGSEAVWRTALMAKGKDWVSAELRRRPGQPGDAVYDVVFEDPLPTREFCQRWCAEEENRLVRFSWEKVAAIVFLVLTIVCAVGAVKSWNDTPPPQGRSARPREALLRRPRREVPIRSRTMCLARRLEALPDLRRLATATALLCYAPTRPIKQPSARRKSEARSAERSLPLAAVVCFSTQPAVGSPGRQQDQPMVMSENRQTLRRTALGSHPWISTMTPAIGR